MDHLDHKPRKSDKWKTALILLIAFGIFHVSAIFYKMYEKGFLSDAVFWNQTTTSTGMMESQKIISIDSDDSNEQVVHPDIAAQELNSQTIDPDLIVTDAELYGENPTIAEIDPSLIVTDAELYGENPTSAEIDPSLIVTDAELYGENPTSAEIDPSLIVTDAELYGEQDYQNIVANTIDGSFDYSSVLVQELYGYEHAGSGAEALVHDGHFLHRLNSLLDHPFDEASYNISLQLKQQLLQGKDYLKSIDVHLETWSHIEHLMNQYDIQQNKMKTETLISLEHITSMQNALERLYIPLNVPWCPFVSEHYHRYDSLRKSGNKYYIAINLYNSQNIAPNLAIQLLELAEFLGKDRIFISVYENGSQDRTPDILKIFKKYLALAGIPRNAIKSYLIDFSHVQLLVHPINTAVENNARHKTCPLHEVKPAIYDNVSLLQLHL